MTTGSTVLEYRHDLAVPAERVFAALTESQHLERWLCDKAESDARPGGRIVLHWTGPEASAEPFEARWLVFEPGSSCAWEGGHSGYPDGYAGRVGFELAPQGEGTVLVTRHRIPARPDYQPVIERYRDAWPRALARLESYLTPGKAARPG
jgi:uncharacterized protein YndB with AHSA1/START domain